MTQSKHMKSNWVKDLFGATILAAVIVPVITAGTYTVMSYTNSNSESSNQNTLNPTVLAAASSDNQNYLDYLAEQTKLQPAQSPKQAFPASVSLNIPLIKQEYALSCEVTTLQMALKYRGIDVSQDQLMDKVGYSLPLKMTEQNGRLIWGDPDEAFVGSVDGPYFTAKDGLRGASGWGVNNGPIAKVASQYRPGSIAKTGASIDDIKQALADKKPVIFWHVRDDIAQKDQKLNYFTQNGKQVTFIENHVALITGYNTGANGETEYLINDPNFGSLKLKESDLFRQWSKYDKDIVVVA